MNALDRPRAEEVFNYFQSYIAKAPGQDLLAALQETGQRAVAVLEAVPQQREDHCYAEGKWSIKEVFQHLIDTERIFCHRALSFAREDGHALPGFDENAYVPSAEVGRRTLAGIGEELVAVRSSTILLFRSFSPAMLLRMGTANDKRMSVRALGWTIAGHAIHHLDVIEQRYN
ncbi:MAG: DinB family protein [Flavobacteriales bacterium]|nr:DinB family protein [Flavobacteriales bacterium]